MMMGDMRCDVTANGKTLGPSVVQQQKEAVQAETPAKKLTLSYGEGPDCAIPRHFVASVGDLPAVGIPIRQRSIHKACFGMNLPIPASKAPKTFKKIDKSKQDVEKYRNKLKNMS